MKNQYPITCYREVGYVIICSMIDVERTRQMTKMAIFEKNERDDYKTVARHDKKSYVGMFSVVGTILSVILGLLYIVVALCVVFVLNPEGISTFSWIIFSVVAAVGFVFHIYFYSRYAKRRVGQLYDESKKKNDYLEEQYRVLDKMYEEES